MLYMANSFISDNWTEKIDSDKDFVRDDSQAKGIVKRVLRESQTHFDAVFKSANEKGLCSNKPNFFARWCRLVREALGDSLCLELEITPSRVSSRKIREYFHLGLFSASDQLRDQLNEEKIVPIVVTTVDSKQLKKLNESATSVGAMGYVSWHALERMVRRSHCHRMSDFAAILAPIIPVIIARDRLESLPEIYIAVSGYGYAPCRKIYRDGADFTLCLSWMPRHMWRPDQEAKLTALADRLKVLNRAIIIDADKFNYANYFDPDEVIN